MTDTLTAAVAAEAHALYAHRAVPVRQAQGRACAVRKYVARQEAADNGAYRDVSVPDVLSSSKVYDEEKVADQRNLLA